MPLPLLTLTALAVPAPGQNQMTFSPTVGVDEGIADDTFADGAFAGIDKEDKQLSELQLVHIPKTGGTTLEDFGAHKLGINWGYRRIDWPGGHCAWGCPEQSHASWQPCSSWHIPREVYTAGGRMSGSGYAGGKISGGADPYAGFKTFCAMRHPFTRAISEYIYSAGVHVLCDAAHLNAGLTAVLRNISAPVSQLSSAWPHIGGQDSAVNLRAAARHRFPQDARPSSDCHLLPQSFYSCDTIIHTETLDSDVASLMHSYGEHMTAEEVAEQTYEGGHRTSCSLQVGDLDTTTLELLRQVYARDFEVGGYSTRVLSSRSKEHALVNNTLVAVFADDVVTEGPWLPESESSPSTRPSAQSAVA